MSARQRTAKTNKNRPEKIKKTPDDGGDSGNHSNLEGAQADKSNEKLSKRNKQSKAKGSKTVTSSFMWGKMVKYIFLLIFIPPFLNYTSLQRESQELKPEGGELYDIGFGQKLFLSCSGQGPPTVILDAPTGMSSDVWMHVAPSIARHAKVCVYDRAGLGFSDRPMNRSGFPASSDEGSEEKEEVPLPVDKWAPFTVERMVDDLHRLITSSSQQPRPLIFVGAEIGALVAQFYTQVYESDVQGVVMVNPLPDNLFDVAGGLWADYWYSSLVPSHQSLQLAAATGLSRLGLLVGVLKQPIRGEQVTDDVINRQKYLLCNPRHLSSVVDEHYFINETFSQIRTFRRIKRTLPKSITTTVLTGNYYDEEMPTRLNKAWAQAQQSLLSEYFPGAQHLVVNGADRRMMYKQTDSIVDAVLRIVKRWKRSM